MNNDAQNQAAIKTMSQTNYLCLLVRYLLCFAIGSLFLVEADDAEDLARAAQSPYDIQRFVEHHSGFDWGPLWVALKLPEDSTPPPCGDERGQPTCSSELMTVLDPPQMIVCLHWSNSHFETYLRFLRERQPAGSIAWRIAGYFEPRAKYFALRHHIVDVEGKPFLVATSQGTSGTGVSSEVENWIDLTGSDLKPALSFTSKATYFAQFDSYISRKLSGTVTSIKIRPVKSIIVQYMMEFSHDLGGPGPVYRLGSRSDTVRYLRTGDHFTADPKTSTVASAELNLLYGPEGDVFSCDQFLIYDIGYLSGLRDVPGTDDVRRWLAQYVDKWCENTPQKRGILALLQPSFGGQPR